MLTEFIESVDKSAMIIESLTQEIAQLKKEMAEQKQINAKKDQQIADIESITNSLYKTMLEMQEKFAELEIREINV